MTDRHPWTRLADAEQTRRNMLSARLGAALRQAGITQTQAATMLGLPSNVVNRYVLGRRPAPEHVLAGIARIAGTTPEELADLNAAMPDRTVTGCRATFTSRQPAAAGETIAWTLSCMRQHQAGPVPAALDMEHLDPSGLRWRLPGN